MMIKQQKQKGNKMTISITYTKRHKVTTISIGGEVVEQTIEDWIHTS